MFEVEPVTQDIDTLFSQLDHIKTLPLEEQEAWVNDNLRPVTEWLGEIGVLFEEAIQSINQAFAPVVEWYEDNREVIEKALANEQ